MNDLDDMYFSVASSLHSMPQHFKDFLHDESTLESQQLFQSSSFHCAFSVSALRLHVELCEAILCLMETLKTPCRVLVIDL
jgi:hypothetical protein